MLTLNYSYYVGNTAKYLYNLIFPEKFVLNTQRSLYDFIFPASVISFNFILFILVLVYLHLKLSGSSGFLPNVLTLLFYRHLKLNTSQIKSALPPKSPFFLCFSDITLNSVKSENSESPWISHKFMPLIVYHTLLKFHSKFLFSLS